MYRLNMTSTIVIVVLLFALQNVTANPAYRIKRVSDQRLAELETLLALSKMRGRIVTVPIGYGRIDPYLLGRRRRSTASVTLEKLLNESDSSAEENSELFSAEDNV